MKTQRQLINNVVGQLEGVGRMMDEAADCQQVLVQLKAAKSAIGSLMNRYVQAHMDQCMARNKPSDKRLLRQLVAELTKS